MKTMTKIYKTLGLLPISVAALMLTACSNEDFTTETVQAATKTIPYVVTVTNGDATDTRATVDNDNKTLYFAEGDKLYITGTNIQGVLDITDGKGTASATFKGELAYTGDNAPGDDLALTATLVSTQQTVGTEVSVDANGAVTVNYPTTAFCADVATAVQKYSNLTGTGTLSSKTFALSQQTAFLNFGITFEDGTIAGTALSAVLKNGETTLCTANVTTALESEKIVAKFVLPIAKGTALSSATVKMGDKAALAITDATLDGKVYNVLKTQMAAVAEVTTDPTATSGTIYAESTTALVSAGVANGGTMMYKVTNTNDKPTSTDGFSADVPTAKTRTAGTYYVWYYVKADATHSDSEISATAVAVTVSAIPPLSLTSPALGQVIGSDGKNYAKDASLPTGVTKTAVIVYVNGSNGLALALQDAGPMTWADANTAATNATPKFSNATWRVPTNADWYHILGNDGDASSIEDATFVNSSNLPGYITGAGGSNFQENQYYWSGTEYVESEGYAWMLNMGYVTESTVYAYFYGGFKASDDVCVRLCLAF